MALCARLLWLFLIGFLELIWIGLALFAWAAHSGWEIAAPLAQLLRLLLAAGAGCLAAGIGAQFLARRQGFLGLPPRAAQAFTVAAYVAADLLYRVLAPTA